MSGEHDDRTMGRRLRAIRLARRKTLRVVAGLAGISHGQLSKIENGALDRRSLIVALANALEISPSELTALPVPAPADGKSDASPSAVRRTLMAVGTDRPGGQMQPVGQLRARIEAVETADYENRRLQLPSLILDLHTTLAQRQHLAELLPLAVMLHAQTVRGWPLVVGAPLDLRWQASLLARRAAEDIANPTLLGVVAWASTVEMLSSGAFDLARHELDAAAVPTDSTMGMQLDGMLALSRSLVASAEGRPAEATAALEHAAALAGHTGQGQCVPDGVRASERGDLEEGRRAGVGRCRHRDPSRERPAARRAPVPGTAGHLLDGLRAGAGTGPAPRRCRGGTAAQRADLPDAGAAQFVRA